MLFTATNLQQIKSFDYTDNVQASGLIRIAGRLIQMIAFPVVPMALISSNRMELVQVVPLTVYASE
jgi:hypothetical protein